ncbi:endonuclease/exonuclease/phosphatase family domain-containing protein 1 [Ictalurus punctatus]|uniref:Endonuclease/exonuclease/phosphatase family domain-containing protein 1 n=1 Tax=Ictalurus punctatus TaxID=7998 RepID=A0A2D0S1S5_ICTPU|nr:endonuclease/exonuclease/phosphatase family domain-containing protein 1 [Ictalurus punctatus]
MGGNLGCHRSLPADPADVRQRGRKFSATCSFAHISAHNPERLNVNAASEEELMTLPGVSRAIARAIVEHRARIGGFRKVEDVALVSGIGAAKLQLIKPEICVSSRRSNNNNNDPREQEHRASVAHSWTSSHPNSPAACTELHLPPGGPAHMASERPDVQPAPCARHGKPLLRVATWDLQRCSSDKANNPGVKEVVCRTLLERDIKLLAVQDLADQQALDKFCTELNQPTLSSVCNWKGPRGMWKCAASGKPTGESCIGSEYSGFLWDTSAGIQLKEAVVLESAAAANGNGNDAQPKAYLGHFRIGSSELTVVNVHVKPPSAPKQQNGRSHKSDELKSHRLSPGVQETLRGVKNVLVVGGFGLPPDSAQFEPLKKEKLSALVPSSVNTNISTKAPQGSSCLDNIWASRSIKKLYTGHCSVVREGLTNPWIPDNWSWGGVASEHCPIMAEFYTDYTNEKTTKEPVHNGSSVAVVERDDLTPKHER